MPRYFPIARSKDNESEQVKVYLRIETGLNETLLPKDVGLRTIDFFMATPISRVAGAGHGSTSFVVGSMYQILGTPDRPALLSAGKAWGAPGSGVLMSWVRSSGSGAFAGTPTAGTRSMNALVIGRM